MPNRLSKLLCETMKILRGVLINASIDEKGDFAFISAASTSMDTSVTFEQSTKTNDCNGSSTIAV